MRSMVIDMDEAKLQTVAQVFAIVAYWHKVTA
jgi:hypothetical protein